MDIFVTLFTLSETKFFIFIFQGYIFKWITHSGTKVAIYPFSFLAPSSFFAFTSFCSFFINIFTSLHFLFMFSIKIVVLILFCFIFRSTFVSLRRSIYIQIVCFPYHFLEEKKKENPNILTLMCMLCIPKFTLIFMVELLFGVSRK